MNNINILILGSNGYIGLELVKLLLNHKDYKKWYKTEHKAPKKIKDSI